MSEALDTTAPHYEENINGENFYKMLKGVSVTKTDSNKIKNECGAWSTLLLDSVDEMVEHLSSLKITRKTIQTLTCVRHKVLF